MAIRTELRFLKNPISVRKDKSYKTVWYWHCANCQADCGCCNLQGFGNSWREAFDKADTHRLEAHKVHHVHILGDVKELRVVSDHNHTLMHQSFLPHTHITRRDYALAVGSPK